MAWFCYSQWPPGGKRGLEIPFTGLLCLANSITENNDGYQRPPPGSGTSTLTSWLISPPVSSQISQPCWVLILIFALNQALFSSYGCTTLGRSTTTHPVIVSLFKFQLWALIWNSSLPSGQWLFPLAGTGLDSIPMSFGRQQRDQEWESPCSLVCGLISMLSSTTFCVSEDAPHLPPSSFTSLTKPLQLLSLISCVPALCFFLFLFSGPDSSSIHVCTACTARGIERSSSIPLGSHSPTI